MESSSLETDLGRLPGVLIRRLHQIYQALFAEECTGFDVLPVQFTLMLFVENQPGADQARISEEVGLDRGTLVNTVARMEEAGLLTRITSRLDRRQKLLALTPHGRQVLEQMSGPVARAHARTIAALAPAQRAQFMEMLGVLVGAREKYR